MRNPILLPAATGLRVAAAGLCLATWWNSLAILRGVGFSWFLTTACLGWAISALFYAVALWGLAMMADDLRRGRAFGEATQGGLAITGFGLCLAALPSFVVARGELGHERFMFNPDITGMAVLVLGAGFLVMARQARRMRHHVEQFV